MKKKYEQLYTDQDGKKHAKFPEYLEEKLSHIDDCEGCDIRKGGCEKHKNSLTLVMYVECGYNCTKICLDCAKELLKLKKDNVLMEYFKNVELAKKLNHR